MVSESPFDELLADLDERKNHVLTCAASSLPPSQFVAFRKLFLNAFGNNGFEGKLKTVFFTMERNGQGRNTFAGEEVSE